MMDVHTLRARREHAAARANAEDASLWRWFSALQDAREIRWCLCEEGWLISIRHRHVATAASFDEAIRAAKARTDARAR